MSAAPLSWRQEAILRELLTASIQPASSLNGLIKRGLVEDSPLADGQRRPRLTERGRAAAAEVIMTSRGRRP